MKHVTSRLSLWVVSVAAVMLVVPARPAQGQSQTPGQITQFDPSLNVVDSVITQDPSGNIGIGTTTPAAALDVATGNLNLAGNLLKGGTLFLHNSGFANTFLGQNAGNLMVTGNNNTATGANALQANTTGCCNTASGNNALLGNTTGGGNTASGDGALYSNTTGNINTAIGRWALISNTTGGGNTASGVSALQNNTTGSANTADGVSALESNDKGWSNTATGYQALQKNCSIPCQFGVQGNENTAIGAHALYGNLVGTRNTAIGVNADVSQIDLFNATAIGYFATVNASNKIRLGNQYVTVIEGQVPYTFTSDKNQKENFQPVEGEDVLRKLGDVNITSWNYIGHDPQHFRHYGPVAQEFFAAFGHDGVGTVGTPTTINSGDVDGILMIAVQALEKRNAELKARLEMLERQFEGIHSGDQR
jgi:hypothetical protein